MADISEVRKQNNQEVRRISEALKALPRALGLLTAGYTLSGTMHRSVRKDHHGKTYTNKDGDTIRRDNSKQKGKMVHDSSNAAYNWRASLTSNKYEYEDFRGKGVVGHSFDERSYTGEGIQDVIDSRFEKDIVKGLAKSLLVNIKVGVNTPQFSVYSAMARQNDHYIDNANVKSVSGRLYSNAHVGYNNSANIVRHLISGEASRVVTKEIIRQAAIAKLQSNRNNGD